MPLNDMYGVNTKSFTVILCISYHLWIHMTKYQVNGSPWISCNYVQGCHLFLFTIYHVTQNGTEWHVWSLYKWLYCWTRYQLSSMIHITAYNVHGSPWISWKYVLWCHLFLFTIYNVTQNDREWHICCLYKWLDCWTRYQLSFMIHITAYNVHGSPWISWNYVLGWLLVLFTI